MRKVLFIAYYFPPLAGAGVQKSLKFVKYLHEFDYQPIVMTVNSKYTRWIKDKSLLCEIPQDTIIYRTPTLDLNWLFKLLWGLKLKKVVTWLQRNILIPDAEITWLPFAKKQIDKIVKFHKIDIVYITGGPFSAMLLGPYCAAKYRLKYVVDFRDEWTNNPTRLDASFPTRSKVLDNKYEMDVVKHAGGIIYTIPRFMKENFEHKYPFLKNKPTQIITNGYDEADFYSLEADKVNKDKLRIVYTGSFYDRRQPKVIWDALNKLISEQKINADKISIKIIGKNTPAFVLGGYNNDASFSKIVKFIPNQMHKDAVASLINADALLLYIAPGPNCKAEMTGKLFEYLRSYIPILAIIPPDGTAADIINNSKTGYIYDSSDLSEVTRGFMEIYQLWSKNKLIATPDKDYICKFNRKNLTKELADLFDVVISHHS